MRTCPSRNVVRLLGAALFVSACAGSSTLSTPSGPFATPRQLPTEIRWVRNSAEYRALTRQTYSVATERLPELSRDLAPQSWAVILDADETVLDNSEFIRRRALLDSDYTEEAWAKWMNEKAAPAVPGAPEFTRAVHAIGGRVVIVTNRPDSLCAVSRANLQTAGIETDLVMCQAPGQEDKNPRFQRVQNGTAAPGIPPLVVVAWFGDNILDFPGMSQASRNDPRALAAFGRKFFVLPNPMYGSWK